MPYVDELAPILRVTLMLNSVTLRYCHIMMQYNVKDDFVRISEFKIIDWIV